MSIPRPGRPDRRTSTKPTPRARGNQRPATPGLGRWIAAIAFSVFVAAWQLSFNLVPPDPRLPYAMSAGQGMSTDAQCYFYFLYHFGVFPAGAIEVPELGATRRDAAAFVAEHGDRIRMDLGSPTNASRFGDYGKLLLFYPDVWMRNDPGRSSVIPFNQMFFLGALLALFWVLRREGHGLLGALLVVLIGSNPFQIVETYGRSNIFSIPISAMLLGLATHLGFLTGRWKVDRRAWAIAIASGAVVATLREIRPEAALVGIAVLGTYALVRDTPLHRRALLVAAFLAAFALTSVAWHGYWAGRFEAARQFVARAGGEVYAGPHDTHHQFWHAVYCGLGDYGEDRGFAWDDQRAFRWATTFDAATNPHPIPYHYTKGFYLDETYDGRHPIAPTDLPEYNRLVRGRVIDAIGQHPWWYAGILVKRALAILGNATPASLSFGWNTLALPGVGWLLLPLLGWFLFRGHRVPAALALFTLPLSIPALLIYSGRGMTFYGIAHLIALAAALVWLIEATRRRLRKGSHGR